MRVRHLQTFLSNESLIQTSRLEDYSGIRLGIDVVSWARSLEGCRDPCADPLGGLPSRLFPTLEREVEIMRRLNIVPIFVCQGIAPQTHQLFGSQVHRTAEAGWAAIAEGNDEKAREFFALSGSRVNSDLLQVIMQHLQGLGCSCIQAPYLSAAQLVYYYRVGALDCVLGPPSLMLFGAEHLILQLDTVTSEVHWVDTARLLARWGVTHYQFVQACLLAGTECCLTFPHLNLTHMHPEGGNPFWFGTALSCVRDAPFSTYLEAFVDEQQRLDHVKGYCVCTALILYPMVLTLSGSVELVDLVAMSTLSGAVSARQCLPVETAEKNMNGCSASAGNASENKPPLNGPGEGSIGLYANSPPDAKTSVDLPSDIAAVIGLQCPQRLYNLLARLLINRKLVNALALGEWTDDSHPALDSLEYRDLIRDIRPLRLSALGLIAQQLPPCFRERVIAFSRYRSTSSTNAVDTPAEHYGKPDCSPGLRWDVNAGALQAEQKRQRSAFGHQSSLGIDLTFCLRWHAHAKGQLVSIASPDTEASGTKRDDFETLLPSGSRSPTDASTFMALILLTFLEQLMYFSKEKPSDLTAFGDALARCPPATQEHVFVALELMRRGCLTSSEFTTPPDENLQSTSYHNVDRANVNGNPTTGGSSRDDMKHSDEAKACRILISRIFSLYPFTYSSTQSWRGALSSDLATFHAIVRCLKRSLRQMLEACVASVLLQAPDHENFVPMEFRRPSAQNKSIPALCPMKNGGGLIALFLMDFHPRHPRTPMAQKEFKDALNNTFTAVTSCYENLLQAIAFWNDLHTVLQRLGNHCGAQRLIDDYAAADRALKEQLRLLHVDHSPPRKLSTSHDAPQSQ